MNSCALETYIDWLPKKLISNSAGYAKRSEKLRLGDYSSEDSTRMCRLWKVFRDNHKNNPPRHKAAASSIADFSSEFFGDLVVVNMLLDKESKPHLSITSFVAENIIDLEPWFGFGMLEFEPVAENKKDFNDTVFAEDSASIQSDLWLLACKETVPRMPVIENASNQMLMTGALAVHCYLAYANEHSQSSLPHPLYND